MNTIISKALVVGALAMLGSSCSSFLEKEPLDQISPDKYYRTADQLRSFAMNQYSAFPNSINAWNAGIATWDNGTDNQAARNAPNRDMFSLDQWKVPANGSLGMESIRALNFFINQTEDLNSKGEITGTAAAINQCLGEAYFFRAYQYFSKLQNYGDYPIIKEVLPLDEATLVEQAKRQPRNEVARFILDDLTKAIELLPENTARKQRLTKNAARLFRSRVALYEGTFEKYHAGSGRVPGDATWPGKDKEWNSGKTFDQAAEVTYFLTQAMNDAKVVADATELTSNTGVLNPTEAPHNWNPYFEMFGHVDPSGYPEVILWREHNRRSAVLHHTSQRMSTGTATGWTRGLVESFLIKNGLPYYKATDRQDAKIKQVKENRDQRLQLFIFAEDDVLSMNQTPSKLFTNAELLDATEIRETTGYRQRKGKNYDPANLTAGINDDSGLIYFRGAEAYLNYIEASYLLTNSLSAEARAFWEKLRVRAGIDAGTLDATISNTDMSVEADVNRASYDWAAFSAGQPIDATLYSIRRERRCEFAGEGMRMADLKRWRAMDQVRNYQLEGVNFWDQIHTYPDFVNDEGVSKIISDGGEKANISSQSLSKYIRPYQIIRQNNNMYNGYTFYQAHYLNPFSVAELQLCSPTKDAQNSNLYQNPGWPTTGGQNAIAD